MDFIRRKYLIYTVNNDLDFMRSELNEKLSYFSLNHVLAIKYIVLKYHRQVLTKEVFANPNFYVFLHVVRSCEVYDVVIKTSFDVTLLYLKQLTRNPNAFQSAVDAYRTVSHDLLKDKRFLEVAKLAPAFADVIGVNYDVSTNPLFHRGEPVRDMEIVFSKLFRKTEFRAVNKLAVLRLLIWAYSAKQDTGLEFEDNDAQDIYTLFQKTGPVVNSELTEKFKAFMFPGNTKTSYWTWLKDRTYDDTVTYRTRPAKTMYEKVLSYIYSELKQGRVNKNMLKLVYLFDEDATIRHLALEIIYGVPGDILAIIDDEDEEWKRYFILLYKNNFADGRTFTSTDRFFDDLFNVAASVDPERFADGAQLEAAFSVGAEDVNRFDDMEINTTYVSSMVYQSPNIDLLLAEKRRACQIYNEDTAYYIKEYNTYLYLTEEDPTVIAKGELVKLSEIAPRSAADFFELFSINVLKYYLDGNLARMGLVLDGYGEDVIARVVAHLGCLEDYTAFVVYATCRDAGILRAVIRHLVCTFNVTALVLFRPFLRENMHHVNEYLERNQHLTRNDKKYILQIITNGRS
ncbi:virion protein [Eastern grey kangaroopox virus]|uniref:Protein E6 homolog n=1 Tax=Eastern grey kangaroopox virus TaxID=2042482 RepID=A0A2C9DT10_9POXV|nr:virion protein [Eastern grey kangaroopox virus]ATI21143.1 virion protein [Eastern grey kangaroopox virus]ATX75050.1 virion protein [Eastern grey kangaroopox virus]